MLKPTTMARYRDYVRNDLVPAFGTLKLDQLVHRHISAYVTCQLAAGRGRTTLYRCLATLSSALGDAVRQHRLPRNPASPPVLRRPPSPERRIWTVEEAARFLAYCHRADPEMADLFEVLIGTGMHKGEALGLHWNDVHLDQGVLCVRCTLSAVGNNRLVITTPKTRSSRGWVAISPRVATALRHHAGTTPRTRVDPDDPFTGLVFCRPDGRPLGPHQVLDRLHQLSEEAGVPRVTVHDLRHLAATITITAGVPLTVVSKTLRHSSPSTTADLYSHLTRQAVVATDHTLTTAARTADRPPRPTWLRPPRDHIHRLRGALHKLRAPAPPAASVAANQHRSARDHTGPGRTKGRPPTNERTTSDLRFRTVGTTGFEPATP
ncbi:tyrosine-type recombinase/integrase [Streptomyces sp. NPDC050848]|uniref:site-specific integrase n=1 Tax=Streptomyces sp. NPDC050848 TaxID=3155791 RepID=UPI0033DDA4FE